MKKRFTKIICAASAAVLVIGSVAVAGCNPYFAAEPLKGDYSGEVQSNGGFAVKKGDYLYYINGVESNTANNEYGTPVKGAVYRIHEDDLASRNYSKVDKVVQSIAYSSNYNGGIFIYGDRIYYGTPATGKNSEGVVQNSYLEMKSTKLDGTETLKDAYVLFSSAGYEYRYVEVENTVYLMYVATNETLFEESSGVTNLHSYNTVTGADTLLAYNVRSVMFDSEDKTNARVYYTMGVNNYSASGTAFNYNQVYTVTADATEDKFEGKLSKDTVGNGWDEEKSKYVNCGDLVLDGIGQKDINGNDLKKTIFNYLPEEASVKNTMSYSYSLTKYTHGNLFYTRTNQHDTTARLFSLKDEDEKQPIAANEAAKCILTNGASAGSYKYIFDGNNDLEKVLIAESTGGITVNKVNENGELNTKTSIEENSEYYRVVKSDGSATILDVQGDYLYYSDSSYDSYSVCRVDYTGTVTDYEPLFAQDSDKKPVRILDLTYSSGWYSPEIIDGYLLFASTTANMSSYNYIMLFDLHKDDGTILKNEDLRALNEKFEGVADAIKKFSDTDKYPTKIYANLHNALNYVYYTGDGKYIEELAAALNAELDADDDPAYSERTLEELKAFLNPSSDNVWSAYAADKKTVNGEEVYANRNEYYYSVLGVMSDSDKETYIDAVRSRNNVVYPEEEEVPWFDGLSTVEKVFFIIGMCVIGLGVIAGVVILTVYLVRKKKGKNPEMYRRRIKVDTTDDKNIDVYGTDEEENE